jgi:hypothetical protein
MIGQYSPPSHERQTTGDHCPACDSLCVVLIVQPIGRRDQKCNQCGLQWFEGETISRYSLALELAGVTGRPTRAPRKPAPRQWPSWQIPGRTAAQKKMESWLDPGRYRIPISTHRCPDLDEIEMRAS